VRRLPALAFAALVVATVGAFFVTQHLKSSTPLYAGFPRPNPQWINPRSGAVCDGVSHRSTTVSFYLLHRADDVDVYIVNNAGAIVRTVASGRHMRIRVRRPDGVFHWDGRTDSGAVAPDGVYHFRVALRQQGRTVQLTQPVSVETVAPNPRVTTVSPALIPENGTPVRVRYRGNEGRAGTLLVYRTDLPGTPKLVDSRPTNPRTPTIWDGTVDGRPAPAGTYLIGLQVVDRACNVGRFPAALPPSPGSTPHAGVTVRYLAAQPPMAPVAAGGRALVFVDSRQRPYTWTLTRVGRRKPVAHGADHAVALHVPLPRSLGPGLYELALRSGSHRTTVPLVANAATPGPRVLVVLPALTWQGLNPVDDDGDGVPDTLTNGGPVRLVRPLADGLPAGFTDEASLLAYLDHAHLPYDLTTDLGVINGIGPSLSGHAGVVLAGSQRWTALSFGAGLRNYVAAGGTVASIGTDTLRSSVRVLGKVASNPSGLASTDLFGIAAASVVVRSHDLITVIRDNLHIFAATSGAFPGFTTFQPLHSPHPPASAAGTSNSLTSIIGVHVGRGTLVEIALPGFGGAVAHNVDAQEFLGTLWGRLRR
jgi:hypothetical protein